MQRHVSAPGRHKPCTQQQRPRGVPAGSGAFAGVGPVDVGQVEDGGDAVVVAVAVGGYHPVVDDGWGQGGGDVDLVDPDPAAGGGGGAQGGVGDQIGDVGGDVD